MRYSVFGVTEDPSYSFCAPLVCALWVANGWKPLMIRVGPWRSREAELTERACLALGAKVAHIDMNGCVYSGNWMSKSCRFFAGLVPGIELDDILMTCDADMAVLDASFASSLDASKTFHILFCNAYIGFAHNLWPMNYIAASARTWLEIAKPEAQDIRKATIKHLDRWAAIGLEPNSNYSDERVLTGMVMGWPHFPQAVSFVSRETKRMMMPTRRIEPDLKPVENAIDMHLCREDRGGGAWQPERWAQIRDLAYGKLSPGQRTQLDSYVAEFTGRAQLPEFGSTQPEGETT